MSKPRLLDLFCGEGGASTGYHRAGFDVTGVDLAAAVGRRYPFTFIRGDALAYLADHGADYDAIAASPPCKVHTPLARLNPHDPDSMLFDMPTHVDLIPATRALLVAAGRPWIIENVPGAPLHNPVLLCGTMFGLGIEHRGDWLDLRRHRLFESSVALAAPGRCRHGTRTVGVYGHGSLKSHHKGRAFQADRDQGRIAMATPWMSRDGLSQAIPPAYTEHLGRQLMSAWFDVDGLYAWQNRHAGAPLD